LVTTQIMATKLEEERVQLTAIIQHWNSARPDLFAITLPNEVSLLGQKYIQSLVA